MWQKITRATSNLNPNCGFKRFRLFLKAIWMILIGFDQIKNQHNEKYSFEKYSLFDILLTQITWIS